MRRFILVYMLIAPIAAHAETILAAHAYDDGSLRLELHDESTGQKMDTTLRPERARSLGLYMANHGYIQGEKPLPDKPDDAKHGCGVGDFFSGKC